MFITFEGIDGSGKSTQIELLKPIAQEKGWLITRNPGGTSFGAKLRQLLLDEKDLKLDPTAELLLFFADRKHHLETEILPALDRSKVILCDRFQDSTFAYQGFGRGLDLKLIDQLYTLVLGRFQPDLTFLFDLDPETAYARATHHNKIEAEGIPFQSRVREGYLNLLANEPERFVRIDTDTLSIEEAHQKVLNEILYRAFL
ncbi:MAG: dTMP kinase [Candidatus Caenarcaniphilales bacterium]|nr:dTMP kinase [Candidatus Caenarcaniphilales bacterium]